MEWIGQRLLGLLFKAAFGFDPWRPFINKPSNHPREDKKNLLWIQVSPQQICVVTINGNGHWNMQTLEASESSPRRESLQTDIYFLLSEFRVALAFEEAAGRLCTTATNGSLYLISVENPALLCLLCRQAVKIQLLTWGCSSHHLPRALITKLKTKTIHLTT